ncbi:extracellular matrix-binding protein ebhB [Corynebacterium striatum]|nr:extracellular matrix-binding protein ebhB [Corynebacterium striatum]
MAVTLTIDIGDFGAESHPDDYVILYAPVFRESAERSGGLVSTAPRRVYLTGGKAAVEVEPGPLAVEFCVRNIKDSSTREFVVPAGGGSLGSLLAASLDYEPVVVTRLQELIDSAGDAAERLSGAALSSAEKADSSAKAAKRFEDAASKYAAAAKVSQDAAKGSEDAAAGLAEAVGTAAKAAKESQMAAAAQASAADFVAMAGKAEANADMSAAAAKASEEAAATSAGNAEKSAGAAKAAQARSEEIASSTSWSGDKLTVNGKTSPSLTGPPGPKGDTGSVENVSWDDISGKPDLASTWEQVKGKPESFPPAPHTHTTAQVEGLDDALAGKADKSYVDNKAAEARSFAASRAVVKQVTSPPSSYESGVLYVIPE